MLSFSMPPLYIYIVLLIQKNKTMDFQIEKQKYLDKLNNPKLIDIDKVSYQYSMFMANAKRFLPELSKEEYRSFFVELLYQQVLATIEQYDISLLKNLKIINHTSFCLEKPEECPPLIFATFHLGPYRLFNSFLFENGFKIALIVDHNVYLSQREDILNNVKPLLKDNKKADFVILDVKDRTSLLKLKNLMLDGYVMSVYVDANSGVERTRSNEFDNSFIPINFFNNTVYVKNGIGKLSLLVNADIVPIISYRDQNETPIIHFHKEIKISDFKDRKMYPKQSIEQVYKILEDSLHIHKTQWLDWIRIHKWIKRDVKTPYTVNHNIQNIFNDDRYSLFILNTSHYLFDLFDYTSYPITAELYDMLKNNKFSFISEDTKNELIEKNVII